jgi:hypothetical protein
MYFTVLKHFATRDDRGTSTWTITIPRNRHDQSKTKLGQCFFKIAISEGL